MRVICLDGFPSALMVKCAPEKGFNTLYFMFLEVLVVLC